MEQRVYEYSVVIPVFQGGEHLPLLYQEIKKVFTGLASSFEIILVDDRGKTNSWKKMIALKKLDPQRIQMIRMVQNLGQHSATMVMIQFPWETRIPIIVALC
ncbi:MAG: glycosyltransferase [Bacteroidota bacterium]